jgi:ligand-binding SRPBCC domain-containing protein
MTRLEFTCDVRASLDEVWEFHETVECLLILTPPAFRVELIGKHGPPKKGVRYPMKIQARGMVFHWTAEYVHFDPPNGFTDRQATGPFRFWEHQHIFETKPGGVRICDVLVYEPPFGVFGRIADWLFIQRDLKNMFRYRYSVTKDRLERAAGQK